MNIFFAYQYKYFKSPVAITQLWLFNISYVNIDHKHNLHALYNKLHSNNKLKKKHLIFEGKLLFHGLFK